eukprot:g26043.t1
MLRLTLLALFLVGGHSCVENATACTELCSQTYNASEIGSNERRQEEAGEHEAGSFPCMADVVKFQKRLPQLQLRCLEEDCHESDSEGELSMPPMSNDMASSCAVTPNDLEGQMERQSAHVQSLKELMGMMVFGTFRVVSGVEAQKRCGEVTVERGPGLLHGCRVKIWGSKNRGRTWDYDRCYVRILTELFGRVIHAEEFGVARQKRFICLKSKVVRNDRFVAFQPINGKLPAIQVPWNAARPLPNSRDLHLVEVQAWADRGPRGQYLEDLKMFHRNSNVSILEPVQKLDFSDLKF